MFIKLTPYKSESPNYINPSYIKEFYWTPSYNASILVFQKEDYIYVKETPEEIMERINATL